MLTIGERKIIKALQRGFAFMGKLLESLVLEEEKQATEGKKEGESGTKRTGAN